MTIGDLSDAHQVLYSDGVHAECTILAGQMYLKLLASVTDTIATSWPWEHCNVARIV